MQTLRFISEAAQDMTAKRSSLSGSDAKEETISANTVDSDTEEADFFDMASPDTKSEVSQYHDCQSEGLNSSSASQVDPTEEAYAPVQNGGVSPSGKGGSLWERWQAQIARGDAAEETLRDHRQQYEQMSAQLFSLKQQHQEVSEQKQTLQQEKQTLQQQNQTLQQQNAALQSDKASLEQQLRQQQADREDEILARSQADEEHQREMHDVKQRYSNLYNRVEAMREQQRQEEDEERERCRSWGYLLRQTGRATGCVALGAIGILTLIHVCEGRDGLKALSRAK